MSFTQILVQSLNDFVGGIVGAFSFFSEVWFFALPIILYPLWKIFWMDHIHDTYLGGLSFILLEVIPPREIEKSPKLMESIFAGLVGASKGFNAVEEYVQGQLPALFSLEVVGNEGNVHYYIRTQKPFRNLVEANIYAQYPDAEVVEVPDYVDLVPRTVPNDEWDLWGVELELTKDDLYPIRTYVSFEEDVTGKMIDPLGGLVESFGKTGPGQYVWLQYIIVPENDKTWIPKAQAIIDAYVNGKKPESIGMLSMVWHDLIDIVRNIIPGLFGAASFSSLSAPETKDQQPIEFRLTPGQKDVLKALERNLSKQMFRTKMRFLYIGQRAVFDKTNVSNFMGVLKQFNDQSLNGFRPNDDSKTYANYLFVNERLRYRQRRIFRRYITRDPDPTSSMFGLSVEELATVYHFPDMAVVSPSLTRVSARRAGAPSNLPILEE